VAANITSGTFPLAYLTDVANDATTKTNLVPFTQFKTDLGGGKSAELLLYHAQRVAMTRMIAVWERRIRG